MDASRQVDPPQEAQGARDRSRSAFERQRRQDEHFELRAIAEMHGVAAPAEGAAAPVTPAVPEQDEEPDEEESEPKRRRTAFEELPSSSASAPGAVTLLPRGVDPRQDELRDQQALLPPLAEEGAEPELDETDEQREQQWREWIRRSMTNGAADEVLPDLAEGAPEVVKHMMKEIPEHVKKEVKLVHHQLGHPGRA
eukprot:6462139-Amphidinium_carterae.1